MLEKFIFSHQKTAFEEALNNNEVSNDAIVFIGDTKEIWNHGTYFDGSTFDPSDLNNQINNVKTSIDKLKIGKSFNLSASFNSTQAGELYNYLNQFKGHGGNITARFALNYNDIVFNEGILLSCRTQSRNNGVAVSGTNSYYYNLTIAYSTEDNYFKNDTSSGTGEVVTPDIGGGVIISPGVGGTVSPGGTSVSLDNYKNYMMLAEVFITITRNTSMTSQGVITSFSYSGVEGVNTYPMYVITSGSGDKFLADNGQYKRIVIPDNAPYLLNLASYNSNTFIELKYAAENKKLIQLDNPPFMVDSYDKIGQVVSVTSSSVILRFSVYNNVYQVGEKKNYNQGYIDLECKSDGIFTMSDDHFNIERTGDGTKFLSDDGSYKEVSGGSEPYIWDGTTSETIYNELKAAIKANRRIIFLNNNQYELICSYTEFGGSLIIGTKYANYVVSTSQVAQLETNIASNNNHTSVSTESYFYDYNTLTGNLILTFNPNNLGGISEYNGEFSFGDTAYTVTFPEGITWITIPESYKPNTTYQFKILNNLGSIWEVGKGEVAYKSDLQELNTQVTTQNAYDTMKTQGTLNSNVIYVIKG